MPIRRSLSDRGIGRTVVLAAIAGVIAAAAAGIWMATRDSPHGGAPPAPPEPVVATSPAFKEVPGAILPSVPDFPAYPGATLVGSAEQGGQVQPVEGYRIKWTTPTAVAEVMAWYRQALPPLGWKVVPSHDGAEAVEGVAHIHKGDIEGYVSAEKIGASTEIVVSLKNK